MGDYNIAIKIAGNLESSFNNAIKGAQSGLSGLGIAGKVGSAALKATAATVTAAGAAIGAVGAYSVNTGKEFKSAMSSAAATAGATEEEYKKMEAAAEQMGKTTSKTAAESANALEYMALAGWDVNTSCQALPSILKMSEASGLDLARTSDLVTDSMSALGVTVDQLPNYLDVVAKAQNKSNQSAEQLMEAYLGVGGTMNNLNVPIEQSATALGVLANRGIKGSEAGTALNAIMVNLTTGTGQAGTMMEKLGVSAFDSEGKFIGLQETLQQLNTALAGCTEEERNAALAAIGGKTHVDALNDLMAGLNTTNEQGISEWEELTKNLENANGALDKMRDTKLDNLEGDIQILQSAAQGFGITVYKSMDTPLREMTQYGTKQIDKLSSAFEKGGLSGLVTELGSIFADGLTIMADNAPQFVDMAANMIDAIVTGLENNSDKIGSALAKLGTAAINAFVRLSPRIIVVGAKMAVQLAKGLKDNLPQISAAAKEAVEYLMTEAKNAFGQYVDFLKDDEVKPFEKIIGLLPAVVAGFAGFKVISKFTKPLSGIIKSIKNLGKTGPAAKKGIGGIGNAMSATAKNIAGAGAGLGMAAAGIWLLTDAAIRLKDAGPEAVTALALMGTAIIGFMAGAAKLGTKLQAGQQGLIAFGGAILMAASGITILTFAAIQLANAGPMAMGGLAIMIAGIAGLLAVAGALGPKLATAAPGLLAFGGAIIMAAAGMAIMAAVAIQLSNAGTSAIAVLAGMAVGLTAFMVVAALLGPSLTAGAAGFIALGAGIILMAAGVTILVQAAMQIATAGPTAQAALAGMAIGLTAFMAVAALIGPMLTAGAAGYLAFGAGLILAAAGIMLLVQAAMQLATAGPTVQIALAALAIGLTAFMAVIGLLAPLITAGAAALAAFGAALTVVGAALVVVNTAAVIGAAALTIMAAALPQLSEYGASGAIAIAELGAAMTIFAGGAALAGAGAAAAAVGFAALTVAAAAADIAFAPLAVEMAAIGLAVNTMGTMGTAAAEAMELLKGSSKGMITSMAKLAAGLAPITAALVPFAAAALAASVPFAALAATTVLAVASFAALMAAIAGSSLAFTGLTATIATFKASASTMGITAALIVSAFNKMRTGLSPAATALNTLKTPVTSAAQAMQTLSGAFMRSAQTISQITFTIGQIGSNLTLLIAVMAATKTGWASGMTQIVTVTQTGMLQMVAVFNSGRAQIVMITNATVAGVRTAFSGIDLTSSGRNMMQGLINGMNSMKTGIENTARSIAQSAANAVNTALQIHSPSRVMAQSGRFMGEGLAVGMQQISGKVQAAADTSLARPVETTAAGIGGISVPTVQNRSQILNEPMPAPQSMAQGNTGGNTVASAPNQFVFSPTYNFNGLETNKDDIIQANKISQRDFEKMMNEYMRKNRRTSFA